MKKKFLRVGILGALSLSLLAALPVAGGEEVEAAANPNALVQFKYNYPYVFNNTGYLRLFSDNRQRSGSAKYSEYRIANQTPLAPETITTTKNTKGKKYTFKTFLYLPTNITEDIKLPHNQSMVKVGNYFYVLYNTPDSYNHGTSSNRSTGFIVRYHVNLKKELDKNGWDDIANFKNKLARQPEVYSKYLDYIKVGGNFEIGHGQTMATDGTNVYMMNEPFNPNTSTLSNKDNFSLMKINLSTLKPQASWTKKFVLSNKFATKTSFYRSNTLTFVNSNTFYMNNKAPNGYVFYKGTISGNKVKVQRMRNDIKNYIGPANQGLTYNPNDGKLYMVCDSSVIASFKPDVLSKKNPKASDIEYTLLNTKRELEYVAFDKREKNKMYLMLTSDPEILVADLPK